VLIPVLDVRFDGCDQFIEIGDGEAADLTLREFAEESLDQVQPRGTGGGEVKMDSRVSCEPCLHFTRLVHRGVVQDVVDLQPRLDLPHQLARETQELLVPPPGTR
jgi:hypothetical protein